jgi:hypothetical protein
MLSNDTVVSGLDDGNRLLKIEGVDCNVADVCHAQ